MGQIIDVKSLADRLRNDIKDFANDRKKQGLKAPKIASVLTSDDPGSIYYIESQKKLAQKLSVDFLDIRLEKDVTEEGLISKIHELNSDYTVSGIIIQLPLKKGFNQNRVVNEIAVEKDIDCLTLTNQGKLYTGAEGFIPCTPNSVLNILKSLPIDITSKNVVVIGRSNIVGKPVAQLMLNENATVTICHSRTKNLREKTSEADILISAIGKPKFIDDTYIKENAILIDVGTSRFEGKITGDIDLDKVLDKCLYVTKVPGGVGALTTTLLINNACEALKNNEN